jgi:hypothetical protein
MNNDCVEVDELILESQTTRAIMPIRPPKKFLGSARPAARLTNTCETACMMAGYLTAHVSSYDVLSGGFRRTCTSVANTARHMRGREATFFECGHLPIEVCLTLSTENNGHLEANMAIRKNRSRYNVACSCKKYR